MQLPAQHKGSHQHAAQHVLGGGGCGAVPHAAIDDDDDDAPTSFAVRLKALQHAGTPPNTSPCRCRCFLRCWSMAC